jgi:hypothetical protein
VTITFDDIFSNDSRMSHACLWPADKVNSCSTGAKDARCALTRQRPGGRSIANLPSVPLRAFTGGPGESMGRATMDTPAMAAPLGSVTVPVIVANVELYAAVD